MKNPNQPAEIEDREKLVRVPFANMHQRTIPKSFRLRVNWKPL